MPKKKEEAICPKPDDCVDSKDMPSLMEMVKNLASDGSKIVSNALKGNQTLASDAVREYRWSVCQTCPMLENNRCVKCGCFMKVKVAFSSSACPMDKWN